MTIANSGSNGFDEGWMRAILHSSVGRAVTRRAFSLGSGAAVVTLVFMGLIGYLSTTKLISETRERRLALGRIVALTELDLAIKSAESARRALAIDPNETRLATFTSTVVAAQTAFNLANSRLHDNERVSAAMAQLRGPIDRRVEVLESRVRAQREGHPAAASAALIEDEKMMANIHDHLGQIEAVETTELGRRDSAVELGAQWAVATLLIGAALALGLIVFVIRLLEAEIRKNKLGEKQIRDLLEDQRQRARQLETANRELEAFSYSVSHDLRAPLRSIDGFSQAVMEDCADKLGETGHRDFQRIRAAAKRMNLLIDDLLALARVARQPMVRQAVDLTVMAGEIIQELRDLYPERQVDVVIPDGLHAAGDPHLLKIVLQNLLSNAWKYTRKKSGARIEFGTTASDGGPCFFIGDNGAGFDMAYASKLFGAFQRFHTEGEFEGTGVGLATVRRILARHGGRVWADAAVDRGATFFFTI